MTETLSDRLRICIASGDGLTKGTSELLREAADELDASASRIAELEARLEIDHAWRLENGKLDRFDIPPEERGNFPDGISCRDETIRLLEEQLADKSRRLNPT